MIVLVMRLRSTRWSGSQVGREQLRLSPVLVRCYFVISRGSRREYVVTRRTLAINGLTLLSVCMCASRKVQADGLLTVRIRADETVRGILPPVTLQNLTIDPDRSAIAHEMASRAPPERAAPVILIIVGAIALVQIAEMVNEMVHQFYYGGVVIDGRKTPPEITNDPKIPPNMVFVFQGDGTVRQFKGGELPAGLLEAVLK